MQALDLIKQIFSQLFRNRKNFIMIPLLFIIIINSASFGSIQLHKASEDNQQTHQMAENFGFTSLGPEISEKEKNSLKNQVIKNNLMNTLDFKIATIQAPSSYVTSSPLKIENNSAFGPLGYNFPGTGFPGDPYIINGLNITGTTTETLIEIRNTDVHFNISNCLLHNGKHGILFLNVTHGLVYNNIIRNNTEEGVKLYQNSLDNKIIHNTVHNNTWDGVLLEYSGNNTIANNLAYENGEEGINVENSHNCTVINNICYENSWYTWSCSGIRFYNCSYSTLENNTVSNEFKDGEGITIYNSFNCTVYNITVSNNEDRGFSASNCNRSTFDEIKSYYNGYEGIAIWNSENSSLTNFESINNSENGIYISNCGNSTFSNLSSINNSFEGITIESSGNSETKDILCENNGGNGLKIAYSNYSTLTNIAVSNNGYGLYMDQTHYCTLYNITSSFNRNNGISYQDCYNSVMSNSNIYNNSNLGIELTGSIGSSFNRISSNHIYKNNGNGINFGHSNNNIFSGNRVYKNGQGIYVSESDYSQIVSNVIYDNFGNGIYIYNSFNGNISFNTIYRNMYKGIQCSFYSENGGGPSTIITKNDLIYNNWDEIQIFYQIRLEGDSYVDDVYDVNHNFYDTYRTPDDDNDGLVDYPYVIGEYWEEKQYYFYDDYPETEPIIPATIHYLSTPIILSPTRWDPATEWMPEPEIGFEYEEEKYLYNGTITIKLLAPIDSEGHSITYSLYYTKEWTWESGLQDWTLLASGITTTTYDWDTTKVVDADYNLAVVATCSEGLNSTFIDTERIQINNSPPELTNLTSFSTVSLILSAFVVITVIQRKNKRVRK
ncbi:MAG: nitrous oxide reductase family maturation protein NosD [Candidatus Hodarchaeota archaeon]